MHDGHCPNCEAALPPGASLCECGAQYRRNRSCLLSGFGVIIAGAGITMEKGWIGIVIMLASLIPFYVWLKPRWVIEDVD